MATVRREKQFEGEEVSLLMDICPCQITGEVMTLLRQARSRVIAFAPHSTHIFQLFDLTLYMVFKRVGKYSMLFDDLRWASDYYCNLHVTFLKRMTCPSILAVFTATDLEFDITQMSQRLTFHPEK